MCVALLGIYFEIDGLPDLAPLACGSLRARCARLHVAPGARVRGRRGPTFGDEH